MALEPDSNTFMHPTDAEAVQAIAIWSIAASFKRFVDILEPLRPVVVRLAEEIKKEHL